MSFFEPSLLTSLSSNFDEHQWVKHIQHTLDEELEADSARIPITIFSVPRPLMQCSPDSYIPQQVAIGPYHHFRPEVYDMERYKVAAAKRNKIELPSIRLQDVVDHLLRLDLRVRANYHRPVNLGPETLAWMMAVDACFLLEFFQVCGVKKGKVLAKTPSRLSHLIHLSGNKTAHNAILRDIVMLENQIPLFVLRLLLELQFSSLDTADQLLAAMLISLANEISPFRTAGGSRRDIEIKDCPHLLDFLYRRVVPKLEENPKSESTVEIDGSGEEEENNGRSFSPTGGSFSKPSNLREMFGDAWEQNSGSAVGPAAWIKRTWSSRPVQLVVKLPWTIISKIPIVNMVKDPVENMFVSLWRAEDEESSNKPKKDDDIHKAPSLDEITIPSVSQLSSIGVRFVAAADGGISGLRFDEATMTFTIPAVELDVNSGVVLRNLVAYEACCVWGPLVLTRFVELMNGIVDTEEDAGILCRSGVIVNRLKSEREVADLWNGMSRSIRLTRVASLDKVIGDVNRYYNGRWRVRAGKFMRRYVFGSWRVLTFLAALVLLLLAALQSFCQVYSCSRFFPIEVVGPGGT
ncbi:Putative UPF0481 protein [Striga hermonthica]|uniref:UPF0481 protein n=1 Tax=Striga hermonthica TaxID=68872 RepID=A0A9N7MPK9_STRHE|nr:Putative UPF0481 protein [Striga hermonthica]